MKLAQFLKEKRTEAGLSQKIVAATLGYRTAQFISNFERAVSLPPAKSLETISAIYRISLQDLKNLVHAEYIARAEKNITTKLENL